MGRVPQFTVELYGKLGRPYMGLEAAFIYGARKKGPKQMGWVPQLWSCMGRRPYTVLEAEQFPSGFEAASRLSVECGQESRLWRGPGRKQQPSAGHLSDIHLGFIIERKS